MDIFATFLRHINVLDEDFSQPRSWHRIRGGAIYETCIFKGCYTLPQNEGETCATSQPIQFHNQLQSSLTNLRTELLVSPSILGPGI